MHQPSLMQSITRDTSSRAEVEQGSRPAAFPSLTNGPVNELAAPRRPTVEATRPIRPLPGGAQSWLVEADDGHAYVLKLTNNPQHSRILINEWISAALLETIGVTIPAVALIHISRDFQSRFPRLGPQIHGARGDVPTGYHFGSQYCGMNPTSQELLQLPSALIPMVSNIDHFIGRLAFDKWVGNVDSPQAVYSFKPRDPYLCVTAVMIDHGFTFGGKAWQFRDAPLQGLYYQSAVYANVQGIGSFGSWLERIERVPESYFQGVVDTLPFSWLGEQRSALSRMVELLMKRRATIPTLLHQCREARPEWFPKWKSLL